jgi:hypothetical protein
MSQKSLYRYFYKIFLYLSSKYKNKYNHKHSYKKEKNDVKTIKTKEREISLLRRAFEIKKIFDLFFKGGKRRREFPNREMQKKM